MSVCAQRYNTALCVWIRYGSVYGPTLPVCECRFVATRTHNVNSKLRNKYISEWREKRRFIVTIVTLNTEMANLKSTNRKHDSFFFFSNPNDWTRRRLNEYRKRIVYPSSSLSFSGYIGDRVSLRLTRRCTTSVCMYIYLYVYIEIRWR